MLVGALGRGGTLAMLAFGCGSDSSPSGGSGPQSDQRGDPAAGKVGCVGATCDVTQGQRCCLWLEGNPIVEKGACLADCAMATPQSGTGVEEITCDGAEDCGGSACCDGKCTTAAQCLPGPNQFCHVTKECPASRNCCDPLLINQARYGSCNGQSSCPWP